MVKSVLALGLYPCAPPAMPGQRPPEGAPGGGLKDPGGGRGTLLVRTGGVPKRLYMIVLGCLNTFRPILISLESCTPLTNASLDLCKSSEMSLAFPDFAQNLAKSGKILRNIPRVLEALHGCTEIEKIQNRSKWV